jgi:glycosyltransferase involved in cell wall biosynthesis
MSMNIAFIDVTTTMSLGGVQTAVWQLAIALTDLGHEVTIYGGNGTVRADLGGRSIKVRTYRFTPRERFPNFGTRFRRLAERYSFARHARADVIAAKHDWIVLTKPFDFFWPHLMPENHPTRFAFMSGGTDFMRGDRWLSKRIAAMVACSHFNAQQNYGRFKRLVRVIFNGVDIGRFLPGRRDVQRRLVLGFRPEDIVFVFAGRLIGLKGLHLAIQALARPSLADVPARLLIVGSGDALPRLQRLAAELGVGERIVFHPAVPHAELPALYACADVGLFPGLGEEAFGISVAEAMACGLPVVASYNGGMPEVIGNEGSCGRLFALGDVDACAEAMAVMCAFPESRVAMGVAARRRIETLFTWRQSAERLVAAMKAGGAST